MTYKLLPFTAALLLLALSACQGHSDAWDSLNTAESIMMQDPDSALAIVSDIDPSLLSGKEENALYTLLLTEAITKTGGYLDSDSLIGEAIEYFRKNKDHTRLVKSLYYKADINYFLGNTHQSMLDAMESYDLAKKDSTLVLWQAKTAQIISDLFSISYNLEETEKYNLKAIELYEKAGDQRSFFFSKCDHAREIYNKGQKKESVKYVENLLAQNPDFSKENEKIAYCYDFLLPIYVELEEYDQAQKCYDFLESYYGKDDIATSHKFAKANLLLNTNKIDEAKALFSSINTESLSTLDSISWYAFNKDLNKDEQNYDVCFESYDSILNIQFRMMKNILSQSMEGAQRDFYLNAAKKEKEHSDDLVRKNAWMAIAFLLLIIFGIFGYLLHIKLKDKELQLKIDDLYILSQKYAMQSEANASLNSALDRSKLEIADLNHELIEKDQQITELSKSVYPNHEQLKSQITSLYQDRWQIINTLCGEFFEKKGSARAETMLVKDIEVEINKLKSLSNLKKIEDTVDLYMGNLVGKLRQQCTFLKPADITFLSLIFAGFAPKAICLITEISLKNFYAKRSRLISRISQSDAPDKDLFLYKLH